MKSTQPVDQTAQAQPQCGYWTYPSSPQKAHQEQGYKGLEGS